MGRHQANRRNRYIVWVALLVPALTLVAFTLSRFTGVPPTDAGTSAGTSGPEEAGSDSGDPPTGCTAEPVAVVAASGIAPVIEAVRAGLPDGECIDVREDDSVSPGTEVASGAATVWVPDSRVRGVAALGAAAAEAASTATSPIVMSVDREAADSFGAGPRSWGMLLQRADGADIPAEVQDPVTSSVAMVLSGALSTIARQATGDLYLGYAATRGTMQSLPVAGAADVAVGTIRISEARLARQQASAVLLEVEEGYPSLDYPWLVSPGATDGQRRQVDALLAAVLGEAGAAARAEHGLLEPGLDSVDQDGLSGVVIAPPTIEQMPFLYALNDSGAAVLTGLSAFDISGSMGLPASADDEGPARIEVMQEAASLSLEVMPDTMEMGLWVFGYDLQGDVDYEPLVPTVTLADGREELIAAISGYDAEQLLAEDHGTALYNTIAAAYDQVQASFKPGYTNYIAIFTDGIDEDAPDGLSLDELTAHLEEASQGQDRVEVMLFGFGEADIGALEAIAAASGGLVYDIEQPIQIAGAFLDAIAQLILRDLTGT